MIPPFDIFRVDEHGHLLCVETAELTFEGAKEHVQALGRVEPGIYILISQKTRRKTVIIVSKTVEPPASTDPECQ
jgi:hypothetical protein